jgi:type I restriction enzyme, S subunit
MEKTKLKNAAIYSSKRGAITDLDIETYISTDNLLQNKKGVTVASGIPPNGSSFPKYKASDILISNIRPYLKKIWLADRSGTCSSDVLVLSAQKGYHPKYIYYSLFRDEFFDHAMKGAKGTKMPRGDKNQILEFEISEFPFSTQEKIVKILSVIDDKIALNDKINDNLERMAKSIYDYWFVQFDFPDAEGKPYKSSGGKMAWDEDLKKEIPKGWKVKELSDILVLEYGKPLKEEDRTGSGYPVLGSNGIVGYHKEYLVEGSGIVVGRKGTAGAIVWVEENFYPIDTTFYVKDKLGVKLLYFHYLMLLRTRVKQVESSSAVPGLNRNFVYSIKIAEPLIQSIQNFNEILDPIFSKIKACNKENKQLSECRDWLLPMLMNGQLKVK